MLHWLSREPFILLYAAPVVSFPPSCSNAFSAYDELQFWIVFLLTCGPKPTDESSGRRFVLFVQKPKPEFLPSATPGVREALGLLGGPLKGDWEERSEDRSCAFPCFLRGLPGCHLGDGASFLQPHTGAGRPQYAEMAKMLLASDSIFPPGQAFGLSETLGAFVGGVLVAETDYKHQIEAHILRGCLLSCKVWSLPPRASAVCRLQ